ncbi:MAG: hypothetical protein PF549_02940 [Patescibacteria group bacterium]|jgi:hypothetical protein|nr:hypothetical protein [Patescibacteria group bacterium]
MLNLFPADSMTYGLGREIKIEITNIPLEISKDIRDKIACKVGMTAKRFFPDANIDCRVRKTNPNDGHWKSDS